MGKNIFNNLSFNALLLVLLILSVSGTFFTMLKPNGVNSAFFIAIILMSISICLGFALFLASYNSHKQNSSLNEQISTLKKHIEQSKNGKNSKQEVEEKKLTTVNPTIAAQELIPSGNFVREELFLEHLLKNIAQKMEIAQAVVFLKDINSEFFSFAAGYAYYTDSAPPVFTEGETLPGQVAKNKEAIIVDNVPEGYITVMSGLGSSNPKQLLIAPFINETNNCVGIIELAAFKPFTRLHLEVITALGALIGENLSSRNNISEE